LSNPVLWQNWMAAYLGYTLRMRTLFRGWPIMVNDTHTRRRRSSVAFITHEAWHRSGTRGRPASFHSSVIVVDLLLVISVYLILLVQSRERQTPAVTKKWSNIVFSWMCLSEAFLMFLHLTRLSQIMNMCIYDAVLTVWSTVSAFDLAWFSSLSSEHLCIFDLHGLNLDNFCYILYFTF